ncbi:hypothetical protein PTTW11_11401 [Pyrenophora teres f. teres]|uniref:Reverse transcriptase Ty1/copia-type domain-containing protein n=1 Tax=Pyrenophora teres f. teres TaxID=97479 RepID=A0A6S6WHD7_9PLEO|nr:hypothetical protein PTTW11_05395 [Pyrenophora teres f. teres]CAE7221291.1 hypothetical protein PTTW11_11401 [Pyrenophora teres f. teres]
MATETASSNGGCTLTREELLGTTNLKAREWRHIDPEIWDDDIEAPNDEIDETAATTYIARAIADYTDRPTADAELFGEFLQDFQGWTEAMFMRANATYTKELKRILRFKGVFTGRVNMPPSEAVAKLLRKEECPRWPDDQFQSTAFDERSAAHMLQQYRLKGRHNTGTAQPTRRAQSQTSARTRDQDAEEQQTDAQVENRTSAQVNQQLAREGQQRTFPLVETIEQTPQTNERRQADQRQPSQQPRLTYNNFDRFREYTPAYPQRPKGISIPPIIPSDDTDPYKAIPPIECGNEKLDPQKINVFSKMWDREKKYTGKPYDLLDDKLKIFYSICYHADIQPEQFHAVFPRILEGRAQDYYLHFVKPYYRPDHLWSDPDAPYTPKETHEPQEPMAVPMAAQPRKRGRPPGSKNKRKAHAYITRKEQDDHELAIKLRNDGVITTSGAPFEASDDQEISDLVGRGVFKFEQYNEKLHGRIRIFKSRLVREVKGKTTKPYEKSRLVIQGYQDHGKEAILTQSPTIQRCSQRLIMSLAPALMQSGMSVKLRDITQAYPQAQTALKRIILAHLPAELEHRYPRGTLLHVIKPLYGIAEAGVHWWTTYHGHHCKELDMATSTYDPCLLITNGNADVFGIVGMQTDDTIMLGTPAFSSLKEKKIQKAEFRSKPKSILIPETQLDFNRCTLTIDANKPILDLRQKGQGGKINLVDAKAHNSAQQYTEQRARGAYIASTCQPEASFDLSVAAQAQQPSDEDMKALNKRLKWQIENIDRGLR